MASFNKVILMGNLTKDPRLGSNPSGSAVCDFSIAINSKFTTNGQDREEVCYVDIVTWGKQADNCGKYLQKGSAVLVEGRLKTDMWNDKDGNKKSRLRVTADRVQFMSSNRSEERRNQNPSDSYDSQDDYSSHEAPKQNFRQPAPQQPKQPQSQAMPVPPQDIFVDNAEYEDNIPF